MVLWSVNENFLQSSLLHILFSVPAVSISAGTVGFCQLYIELSSDYL